MTLSRVNTFCIAKLLTTSAVRTHKKHLAYFCTVLTGRVLFKSQNLKNTMRFLFCSLDSNGRFSVALKKPVTHRTRRWYSVLCRFIGRVVRSNTPSKHSRYARHRSVTACSFVHRLKHPTGVFLLRSFIRPPAYGGLCGACPLSALSACPPPLRTQNRIKKQGSR